MSLKPLKVFRSPLSAPADNSPHNSPHSSRVTARKDSKNIKSPLESPAAAAGKTFLFYALKEGMDMGPKDSLINTPKGPYVTYKKSGSKAYRDDFSVNIGKRNRNNEQERDSEQSSRQDSMMSSVSSVDPINWLQSVMIRKVSKQRPSIRRVLPQPFLRRPLTPTSPSNLKLKEVVRRKSCHCSWCGGISSFEKKTLHVKPAPVNNKPLQLQVEAELVGIQPAEKELTKKYSNSSKGAGGLLRKNSNKSTSRKRENSLTNLSNLLINKKIITIPNAVNSPNSSPEEAGGVNSARPDIEQPKYNEMPKRRGSRFLMEFLEKQNLQSPKPVEASPRRNSFNYAPTMNLLNESGIHREASGIDNGKSDDSPRAKHSRNLLQVNDSQLSLMATTPRRSDVLNSFGEHVQQSTGRLEKDSIVSTKRLDDSFERANVKCMEKLVPRTSGSFREQNNLRINNYPINPFEANKEDILSPGIKVIPPEIAKKSPRKTTRKVKPLSISRGNSPRVSPLSIDHKGSIDILKSPSTTRANGKVSPKKIAMKKKRAVAQSQSQISIPEQNQMDTPKISVKGTYLQKIESQLSKKIGKVRSQLAQNLPNLKVKVTLNNSELMGNQSGLYSAKNVTARSKIREGMYISLPGTPRDRSAGKEFIISTRKEKPVIVGVGLQRNQSLERLIQKPVGEKKMGSGGKEVLAEDIMKRYQPQRIKRK